MVVVHGVQWQYDVVLDVDRCGVVDVGCDCFVEVVVVFWVDVLEYLCDRWDFVYVVEAEQVCVLG